MTHLGRFAGPFFACALGPSLVACTSSSFDVGGANDGALDDVSDNDTLASEVVADVPAETRDASSEAAADARIEACACETGLTCNAVGVCCKSGAAVTAFEASPMKGNICNPLQALTTDGTYAGLDYSDSAGIGSIDGHDVTGCVGVDFGSTRMLDPVVVRAAPSADACSVSPCSGTSCGSGDDFRVFQGTTAGAYTFVAAVPLTVTALADYPVAIGTPARFVVVCRGAFGAPRDDVIVDSIVSADVCP